VWAIIFLSYVNTKHDSTGSDTWFLSEKIMILIKHLSSPSLPECVNVWCAFLQVATCQRELPVSANLQGKWGNVRNKLHIYMYITEMYNVLNNSVASWGISLSRCLSLLSVHLTQFTQYYFYCFWVTSIELWSIFYVLALWVVCVSNYLCILIHSNVCSNEESFIGIQTSDVLSASHHFVFLCLLVL